MLTRTTTALLDDLADPANERVWSAIDERYRPVLVAFGRTLGLGAEDAADAAQEALARFVKAYRDGQYQRGRGRLSSWIIGIARNCIADQRRRGRVGPAMHGLSAIDQLPDDARLTVLWEGERDRIVLRRAMEALRTETRLDPRTVQAFELIAVRQLTPADIAEQLGMTPNDVYLAKHRCLKRLRAIVEGLTAAYEEDV